MNNSVLIIALSVFLAITISLGFLGWRQTRSSKDYLIAGGNVHPVLMALAYGSTFISTSAIVGFGGAAGVFGMSLIWLTFFTIFVGVFIAFIFFGLKTRELAASLKIKSFPEFLGIRFQSTFIRKFSAGLISISMPLYAAAVMIGGARFLEESLEIHYTAALACFSLIVVGYVFFGGLKGVIYNDALQSSIMFIGMSLLILLTYTSLGGVTAAHTRLDELRSFVPVAMAAKGHQGWASMPAFNSEIWWFVVSTLILGVGIGVLAQPQLAVRFMTVKSSRDIYRGLGVGAVFILMMTGVAFTVGALSNVYFLDSIGKTALAATATGGSIANVDRIIPLFITQAMPGWMTYLFLLTLISAAMSTLSGQFHMISTCISYDLIADLKLSDGKTLWLARAGTIVGFLITFGLALLLPPGIIAIATAIFFGFCASAFLPVYTAALYWPRVTPAGAVSSMISASISYLVMILFIHEKEAAIFGLCKKLFGVNSLASAPLTYIDPLIVTLPISVVVLWLVSIVTDPVLIEDIVPQE